MSRDAEVSDIPFDGYQGSNISQVAHWSLCALGLEQPDESARGLPAIPEIERLVMLVFDGLGARQIEQYESSCPYISSLAGTSISSTFPATTASALTTLCTGEVPARHGIVGYVFRSKAGILNVVKYLAGGEDARVLLDPADLQPVPTMFERATSAGANSWVVTADPFKDSGFTNVFLRGGQWSGWKHPEEMPAIIGEVLPLGMRSLVYAYYDGLDTAGHISGVGSRRYLSELERCDEIAAEIGSGLSGGEAMILLSDHGMVNVPAESRSFVPADIDGMCNGIGGEARCRYFYPRPGCEDELERACRESYSDSAWVITRADAISAGLFGGQMEADSAERVGEIVVIAKEIDWGLFRPSRNRPYPIGNHGSVSPDEVLIPFRLQLG